MILPQSTRLRLLAYAASLATGHRICSGIVVGRDHNVGHQLVVSSLHERGRPLEMTDAVALVGLTVRALGFDLVPHVETESETQGPLTLVKPPGNRPTATRGPEPYL